MSFRKRELERLVLYRFLELHPDPPEGDVKRGESPDFTIGRVGIEITQHFWDASAQGSVSKRVAALRKEARRAAQEEWLRRGGRRVGLVVGWNERLQPPTTDMDRAEFAKRLADAVEVLDRQGIPGLDNAHARRSAWHSLPKELRPPEVTYVYELPHTDSWESSIGGAIPRLSVEHVQDAVDRKEPLLSRYREGCDKVWLLIYGEDSAVGSMFAGSWQGDEPICGEVVTGFDRIYFLRSGTELLEFSTRPRSLMDDSPTGQSKDPRHGG